MTPRTARVLWIQADPLSGGSGSQVEFPLELGPFFGGSDHPNVGDELFISILTAGVRFPSKKLDCHHNDVWRLNLPTPHQGHGPYRRTLLCFERTEEPSVVRLTVLVPGTPLEQTLRRTTRRLGRIRTTLPNGNREYGFF
jgi:hypothetical protein